MCVPFRLRVGPAEADPPNCTVELGGALAEAVVRVGLVSSVEVRSFDVFGNERTAGGDTFEAWLLSPGADGSAERKVLALEEMGDGSYTCAFSMAAPGAHELHVHLDGQPISDSPYLIDVAAGADAPAVEPPLPEGSPADAPAGADGFAQVALEPQPPVNAVPAATAAGESASVAAAPADEDLL
ncbi:hypothetical protein T492DRAFT_840616 [Pavlovales sp. CCMP2436]|nr:hypothetical protein T492DRAFT_840616 [Pavlovales sp. CCMP2436]